MRLSQQNIVRFYHIWLALLNYVNDQLHLDLDFPEVAGAGPISKQAIQQLRDSVWAHDDVRERFVAENPAQLAAEDLAIVASWDYRVAGRFSVVRHLKKYTLFLSHTTPAHVYGVLGLVSAIEDVIPMHPPFYVDATLLPFEHQIIYDTLLIPYNILLGPAISSGITDQSRTLQEREGIITSLLPEDLFASTRSQRAEIPLRNRKVFTAFRRDLRKAGLSELMVEIHATTIENFAQNTLLAANPPQGILELTAESMQAYLEQHPGSQPLTSFKRFVRFLLITERIEDELGEYLRTLLNRMHADD
jgi:hypothetical protein